MKTSIINGSEVSRLSVAIHCFVMLESNVYGFFTERSIDSFSQLDQYICIGRMIPFMKPLRRSDYNLTLKDSRIFEGLRRDELYEAALQTLEINDEPN